MTQKDKELLLKDLCARLPYGVKMLVNDNVEVLQGINTVDNIVEYSSFLASEIEHCKPYLFPLSSMTEEQEREYNTLRDFVYTHHYEYEDIVEDMGLYDNWRSIDYLNAHHFDYRGLIEKGLAIDATGLNIY